MYGSHLCIVNRHTLAYFISWLYNIHLAVTHGSHKLNWSTDHQQTEHKITITGASVRAHERLAKWFKPTHSKCLNKDLLFTSTQLLLFSWIQNQLINMIIYIHIKVLKIWFVMKCYYNGSRVMYYLNRGKTVQIFLILTFKSSFIISTAVILHMRDYRKVHPLQKKSNTLIVFSQVTILT